MKEFLTAISILIKNEFKSRFYISIDCLPLFTENIKFPNKSFVFERSSLFRRHQKLQEFKRFLSK
jgi:hypothetical protein